MLKILVTGSTGFIGCHLVPELSKKYKLVCVKRNMNNIFTSKNVSYILCDLTNKSELIKKLNNYSFDVVLHLASESMESKDVFRRNMELTKNLLDFVALKGIRQFIFTSTCAIYDKIPLGNKINEEYKLNPNSNYAKSKLASEHLIKEYAQKYNFSYTILRLHMVYGKGDKNICPLISLIKGYKIIPLIHKGNYFVQPLYVEDAVKALIKSINNKVTFNKTYILAGPSPLLFKDLIILISKEMNKKRIFIRIPFKWALTGISIAILLSKLMNKKLTINQDVIKRAIRNSSYTIPKIKKDLKINPISIHQGIKKLICEYY